MLLHKNFCRVVYLVLFFLFSISDIFSDRRYTENLESFREEYIQKIDTERMNRDGLKYIKSGNITEAVKLFEAAAIHEDQRLSLTYNNLGYAHFINGDYQTAKKFYKKSIQRNPSLILPHQNIGYIYYKQKNWYLAVKHGDTTLNLRPNNQPVLSWIDAARRELNKQKSTLLKKANKKLFCKQVQVSSEIENEENQNFLCDYPFGIEFIAYTDVNFKISNSKFTLTLQPGSTPLPPLGAYLDYNPSGYPLHLKFYFSKPYLGVVNPQVIDFELNIEFIFHIKKFFIGLGILAAFGDFNNYHAVYDTHLQEAKLPPDILVQLDYKFGALFGIDAPQDYFIARIYTHFALRDDLKPKESFTIRFDQAHFDMIYKHIFLPNNIFPLSFQLGISTRELFITEYGRNLLTNIDAFAGQSDVLSHYLGNYDFGVDFGFGKLNKGKTVDFSIGFGFTFRLYMKGENNANVVDLIGNGQGFFGLDLKGLDVFSGIHAFAYIPRVYLEQIFFKHIILRQHFAYEIASLPTNPGALSMRFEAGFIF